jgi:hypothetical protein
MTSLAEQAILDSLLDSTLDDLADRPEFKPWPVGTYQYTIVLSGKVINETPNFEAKLTCVAVLELADEAERVNAPKEGDTTNVLFNMKTEFGQGDFKAIGKVISEALGLAGGNRAVVEATSSGLMCAGTIGARVNSKDKTKVYNQIVQLEVIA